MTTMDNESKMQARIDKQKLEELELTPRIKILPNRTEFE